MNYSRDYDSHGSSTRSSGPPQRHDSIISTTSSILRERNPRPKTKLGYIHYKVYRDGPIYMLNVVECEGLPVMDKIGSCDAYVVIKAEGMKVKTKVVKDDLNPIFNEEFRLKFHGKTKIVFEVYDWDRIGKNELIGEARVDFSDLWNEKEEFVEIL